MGKVKVKQRARRNMELSLRRVGCAWPPWARGWKFKGKLLKIYTQSVLKNIRYEPRGITFQVDHIVPLKGENVCGLHVPWNLHIIATVINQAKRTMVVDEWLGVDMLAENRRRHEKMRATVAKRKARNKRKTEKRMAARTYVS